MQRDEREVHLLCRVDWRVLLFIECFCVLWGRGVRGRGARVMYESCMRVRGGLRRGAVRDLLEWGLRLGLRGEVRGEAELLRAWTMRLAEGRVLVLRELERLGLLGLEPGGCGVCRVRRVRRGGSGRVCG